MYKYELEYKLCLLDIELKNRIAFCDIRHTQ